jgi:DNA gyrase/topoisomerase IV subunit A
VAEPTRWVFRGMFERGDGSTLRSVELPIGTSIEAYKESVLASMLEKKLIRSFVVNHPDENSPQFDVVLNAALPESDDDVRKMFKLTRYITRKCMNFLDRAGRVKEYKRVVDIVDDWLEVKMEHMAMRKKHLLDMAAETLEGLQIKRTFVSGVLDGTIRVFMQPREEISRSLAARQIPAEKHALLMNMPLASLTREMVDSLDANIKKQEDYIQSTRALSEEAMFNADLARFSAETSPVTKKRRV